MGLGDWVLVCTIQLPNHHARVTLVLDYFAKRPWQRRRSGRLGSFRGMCLCVCVRACVCVDVVAQATLELDCIEGMQVLFVEVFDV